ncbi:MAG: hypothetical protein QXU69_10310 [Thermofilaceae archaeon]
MSYEYRCRDTAALRERPLRAERFMRLAVEAGLRPYAVRVDNAAGLVVFYFERPLSREEKERLDRIVGEALEEREEGE